MKKKPILVLAASLLTGLLAGCGTTDPAGSSSEPVTPSSSVADTSSSPDTSSTDVPSSEEPSSEEPSSEEPSSEEPIVEKHALTIDYVSPYSVTTTYDVTANGEMADDLSQIEAGASVTIVASGFGYYISSGSTVYLYLGDDVLSAKASSEKTVTFTFTMPEEDTDVVICPAGATVAGDDVTSYYSVDFSLPESGFKVYGYKAGEKYTGTFSLLFLVEDGYLLNSVAYSNGASVTGTVSPYASSYKNGLYTASFYNTSSLSAGDTVTFTVNGEYKGVKSITWEGTENIKSIDGSEDYSLPTSKTVGTSISISSIVAIDGKYITAIKVADSEGTDLGYTGYSTSSFNYTMPDKDIVVTFEAATCPTIEWEESATDNLDEFYISTADFYSDAATSQITSAAPNSYVYVYFKPKTGYKPTKFTYTADGVSEDASYIGTAYGATGVYSVSFRMPSADTTLSITLSQSYSVSVSSETNIEGCSLSLGSTTSYGAGETASVMVTTVDRFHALKSIVATYGGEEHTWVETDSSDKNWEKGQYYVFGSCVYFQMPAANVTLKGVFEELEAVSFTASIAADSASIITSASANTSNPYSYSNSVTSAESTFKSFAEGNLAFSAVTTGTTHYAKVTVTYSDASTEDFPPTSIRINSYYDSAQTTSYFQYINGSYSIPVTKSEGVTVSDVKFVAVERTSHAMRSLFPTM